jgi:hypothetical protein
VILSATILPTEKLSFTLTGSFTDSTAEIDSISFDVDDDLAVALAAAGYDYDFAGVEEYSDLDIQQWGLELTSEYEITQNLALGVGVSVDIYEDDDPYLFDDSGELYMMSASLNYVF